ILPSVGNFICQKSSDEVYDLFGKTNFITFIVYSLTAIGLALLINDVILIVAHGDVSYLLDMKVVLAIVGVYYFLGMRQNIVVYKNAYGLYWESRFVPLITAILNLTLSIVFGLAIGLVGIFLATIISHIIASIIIETQILFKHGIKHSVKNYYFKFIVYAILLVLEFILCYFVLSFVSIANVYLAILVKGVIIVAIIALSYVAIFSKTSGFRFIVDTTKKIFQKRLNKNQ
ncbi:MAG: hypothetical protein J6R83_04160, partial [Clostridia bacterium]|nr:hypothetical protein [Clostridia bacterium]